MNSACGRLCRVVPCDACPARGPLARQLPLPSTAPFGCSWVLWLVFVGLAVALLLSWWLV